MVADTQTFQVYVRYDGRSYEFSSEELDLGDLSRDADVIEQVAQHVGVDKSQLRGYVVDRHENGNVTLRPQAEFGGYSRVIRTPIEIEELYIKASEAALKGTKYPGMSYEEGLRDALQWLTDDLMKAEELL